MTESSDRLDRIEKITESNAKAIQALSETVASHSGDIQVLKQLVESNARSNQALSDAIADTNRQQADTNRQQADTNRQQADTNRQLAEHIGRNAVAIQELSILITNMARIFNDHINDDRRH